MIHPECQIERCRRTVGDGAPICTHCSAKLADQLRGVPGLLDDLLVAYSRQDRITSGGGGGGEAPLPYREDLPEAVWELGNTVTTCLRAIVEPGTWPVLPEVAARPLSGRYGDHALYAAAVAALMLAERAHVLRRHPAAIEMYDELTHAIKRARARTDRRPPAAYRGPCPACGAEMYARPQADIVKCGCGEEREGRDLKDWLLDAAADQLLTADEVSRALTAWSDREVRVGTVKSWKSRGKLAPHGWLHDQYWVFARPHLRPGTRQHERCCRPLYRLGDAAELLGELERSK